jgi:hypothetical protein
MKIFFFGYRKSRNSFFFITITVKQLNNIVIKSNHVESLDGNLKLTWSDCPSIWLIFEVHVEPDASPTPNTFRALSRLCKSPQLPFLLKKSKAIEFNYYSIILIICFDMTFDVFSYKLPARNLHICLIVVDK